MKDFIDTYYQKGNPVVLKNFSGDWLCLKKWTYDFFQSNYRDILVKCHTIVKGNRIGKLSSPYEGEMYFGDFIDILKKR